MTSKAFFCGGGLFTNMSRIWLYFVLVYSAMATEVKPPSLPLQETIMDKSGWVYVITRDLSTLVTYPDGGWECKSEIAQYDQQTYLKMLYQNADKGNWLRKLPMLSRHGIYHPDPWEAMGITKEQYDDWLATGILKTHAELDAAKAAKSADEQKQVAVAMAEISQIKYYINLSTGVWHIDPNCPDNVGTIEVGPFDIMEYSNQKSCEKCGVK